MRILHDPSIFERKPLNFFNRSGETVLFRRGKKDREEAYSMGNSQSLRFAFCCTYGSRQFASGFYHDRRLKQSFYSLDFIESGELHCRQGRKSFIAESGDVVLMKPGNDVDLLHLPQKTSRSWGFIFCGSQIEEIIRMFEFNQLTCTRLPDRKRFAARCSGLHNILKHHLNTESYFKVIGASFEFFHCLWQEMQVLPKDSFAAEIAEFLNNNFQERIDMVSLSKRFHLSQPTLTERFENQYHTSPVKYLKRIRLEHAAWLLRNTETSIKEIAFASGFSSLQSFCFVFKNTYGTSPGLFRK
ncbi:MAG: AraC family transcriptional regulator [Victivallales bacterium]|nr:AraC family transcriptional regulator [Victivallales bacterium]